MEYNYSREDIIAFWKKSGGIKNTRKRAYVDPRNYLIAILYYKFECVEEELAPIFGIHRSSINHNKVLPYYYSDTEDKLFLENVKTLIKIFPFIFPEPIKHHKLKKLSYNINLKIDINTYNKLKVHGAKDGRRPHHVASAIIRHAVKSWTV